MFMKLKNFIGNIPLVFGHFLIKIGDRIILYGVDIHIKFNTDAGKKFTKIKAMAQMLSMQTSAPVEMKQNAQTKLKQTSGIIYAPKKSD